MSTLIERLRGKLDGSIWFTSENSETYSRELMKEAATALEDKDRRIGELLNEINAKHISPPQPNPIKQEKE